MGFPNWTLWGMGLSAAAALIFVLLAYLAQSPRQVARFRWLAFRLAGRGRSLTGYGLAALLVALAFFLAGIPIDESTGNPDPNTAIEEQVSPAITTAPEEAASVALATFAQEEGFDDENTTSPGEENTPESGAFLRPPTATPGGETAETGGEGAAPTEIPEVSTTARPTAAPSSTATPNPLATPTPTATATPSPTITSTPTLTPTPISGPTALVDTLSSTLWVRRTPGGEQLELILNGDVVILQTARLSVGGVLWQEVRTVSGNLGWVQAEFLLIQESAEQ